MGVLQNVQDRHQGLVCSLAVILTLSATPGYAELSCPPAVANTAYTFTAENYHITAANLNDIHVYVSVESQPLLECELTPPPSCNRFGVDQAIFPAVNMSARFTSYTGFDIRQMKVVIDAWPDNVKANFTVRWGRADSQSSAADLAESCLVQEGGLVDECTPVNPCVNADSCQDTGGGFVCDCQEGYSGMTCKAGDNKLRCSDSTNGNTIFLNGALCSNITIHCKVAALVDNSDLNITGVQSFNNISSYITVDVRASDTAVSFNVCTQAGIPQGQYLISYDLMSPTSVDTFNYTLIVAVFYNNSPPKLNKPADSRYVFSVPEDFADQSVLKYVDKSTTAPSLACDCIVVVDTGSTNGLDSLLLTAVSDPPLPGPVIFVPSNTSSSFGYFYTSGKLDVNNNYTFVLRVSTGGILVDTATVVFTITDVNSPPVCSSPTISLTVDIRSLPSDFLGSVYCTDDDPTPLFKEITYSLEGDDAEYFSIDKQGTITAGMSLLGLSPGVINFTAIVEGYSDHEDDLYNFTIPVYVNITVPKPDCNFTLTSRPQTWEVNSTFVLKLECDNKGVDKLQIEDLYYTAAVSERIIPDSSTAYTISFTLLQFVPGPYSFTVITSLGGPEDTETVTILMSNSPRFSLSYGGTIPDISPVGSSVFGLNVIAEMPNHTVSWILTSGDQYSLFIPHNGYQNIVLTLVKSVEQYVGQNFSIVFEATDLYNSLTAEYTWNFTISDTNQAPVCYIPNPSNINSGMPAGTIIFSINCSDPDITPEFKHLTYSIYTVPATVSLNLSSRGDVVLVQPFPRGVTFVRVDVNVSDISLSRIYPINITVIVPKPDCNFTLTSRPQTWEVNSTFVLKLECDNKGVDKLQIEHLNYTAAVSERIVPESSTAYTISFTLLQFVPGPYSFTVITSLGGPEDTETVFILMSNPPRFSLSYGGTIPDIWPVGSSVFGLNVIAEMPNHTVSWIVTSGDQYSLFIPHNGSRDILLTLVKSVEQYVGQNFSIVFEATDLDNSLTAEYTWNFTISDTNQAPVCYIPNPSNINSGMPAGTIIFSINCSDPDITPEFKHLTYSIYTVPPTVSLNLSSRGDVVLVQPFPPGVTFVRVDVNVSDISLSRTYPINITVIVVRCPTERGDYGLDYLATPVNTFANVSCPSVYTGQVSRFCHLNHTWDQTSYTRCRRKDLLATTDLINRLLANPSNISDQAVTANLEIISQQLNASLANYSTVLSGDIQQMVAIIGGVQELTQRYPASTLSDRAIENFARASNSLLAASDHTWAETLHEQGEEGARLVVAMDGIVNASLRLHALPNEDPIVLENLVIKRASTSDDIHFPKPEDFQIKKYDNSLFLDRDAFINSYKTVSYGIVVYENATDKLRINPDRQSDGPLQDKVLNSDIISFTWNVHIPTLSPPLELFFDVLERNYSNASCGYLNTRINETGVWATDGCTGTRQGNTVKCSCNHLTNFGILMSPFGEAPPGDNFILSIISAAGCAISIICLLVTVIVYICLWKYVTCDRSVLHVNLCICLILAYTIFLAGVDRTDSVYGCKVVAALLHYVYLAVFCIMLSEGIEIFKSVSFVFTSKSILWKLILFSYGVPLIIVAVSLGVTKTEGYGSKTSCWLSTSNGLIWAFVGPVLLILLINTIIIFQVLWIMQRSKQMMNKTALQRTKSVVRTLCILSPILGLTWVFGVLSVNRDTLVFQYLFAIFNSLQGVMIFICYCVIAHQVRDGFKAIRRKYRAKSFDSSQILSQPVSSNAKHSDSETNSSQQPAASNNAGSTSTANTSLSDIVPSASQNHVIRAAQGQTEADTSTSRGRRRNIDPHQLGGTVYSNSGYHDNMSGTAQVYSRSVGINQVRQQPYVQRPLTPAEARAIQNWRGAQEAIRGTTVPAWPSVSTSPGSSYQGSKPWLGYAQVL